MSEPRDPSDLGPLSEAYRRTPPPDPGARGRLDARLRGEPRPRRGWVWISPAGELALRPAAAAAFAALLLASGFALSRVPGLGRAPDAATHVTTRDAARGGPMGERVVEFVLVASEAASVAVVGDFNDWDATRTPMRRVDPAGTWIARVPLAEGRRVYAFVVDGDRWVTDPGAPLVPPDEFGGARSVIVVGGSEI